LPVVAGLVQANPDVVWFGLVWSVRRKIHSFEREKEEESGNAFEGLRQRLTQHNTSWESKQ
jgi:hypothetical protein